MIGYKFVRENLKSEHGDIQWAPGEWQKCEGELSLCKNGLHASQKPVDSLNYIFGTRWFKCEAKGGRILKGSDKFCAPEMRLLQEIPKKVLIQFAIDCARKVLPVFEREYPNDKRPRKAIEAAEIYLKYPSEAAREAAWAANEAAWAAFLAAWAACATRAAWAASAAREATRAACATRGATSAARAASAAREAANEAMKKWQNRHLLNLISIRLLAKENEQGGDR